jgi:hypothetical protein
MRRLISGLLTACLLAATGTPEPAGASEGPAFAARPPLNDVALANIDQSAPPPLIDIELAPSPDLVPPEPPPQVTLAAAGPASLNGTRAPKVRSRKSRKPSAKTARKAHAHSSSRARHAPAQRCGAKHAARAAPRKHSVARTPANMARTSPSRRAPRRPAGGSHR